MTFDALLSRGFSGHVVVLEYLESKRMCSLLPRLISGKFSVEDFDAFPKACGKS
jgi:hypothetical protein